MTDALAPGARARIRRFSTIAGVIGFALIAVLGWDLLSPGWSADPAPVTSDDFYYPWENPDATSATADGDTWRGRGQEYIPLGDLTPGEPLEVVYEDDAPISGLYLSDPGGAPPGDERDPIDFSIYGDGPAYVIPSSSEMELWLRTRSTDPWTVTIRPARLEGHLGTVSGVGPLAFHYTGASTAARVRSTGEYSLSLDIVTDTGVEDGSGTGGSAWTVAWPDTSSAVFAVDTDEETAWSVQFLELPDE